VQSVRKVERRPVADQLWTRSCSTGAPSAWISAGYEPMGALELAADARVDLHELLELIDRGCPPQLAARIAAPL
jgi:hypothetical protein